MAAKRKWWPGAKSRKGFSGAQYASQPGRPGLTEYLSLAWGAHCRCEGIPEALGARCLRKRCKAADCAYCTWYEDTLEAATGHRSTTECNAGRDFDFFMAALEEIHGEGIDWQIRKFHGDANRILHAIRRVSADAAIDEEYLQKIATNALREHDTPVEWVMPELHLLAPRELVVVKNAALAYVRGKVTRGEAVKRSGSVTTVRDEDPF